MCTPEEIVNAVVTLPNLGMTGGMHVLSTTQFAAHLYRQLGQQGRLLDIGAGDGGVTQRLAPLFTEVFATETDTIMRWRLRSLGYRQANR